MPTSVAARKRELLALAPGGATRPTPAPPPVPAPPPATGLIQLRIAAAPAAVDDLEVTEGMVVESLADEPPAPPAPAPAPDGLGDDLQLKPALAAIERAYVAAAMARTGNNQTVAARMLGLSRFGLQKKLRRLALAGGPADDQPEA